MNDFYNKLKYFEETEGVPREVYYHYTSLDALYEIIRTHTFRLMSLKSSNDKKELFYKSSDFIKDVAKVCDSEPDEAQKAFFKLMQKSLFENQKAFEENLFGVKKPYALCLSSKKDNLTHWDRYANNCKGVSIGFNVSALNVHYSRMNCSAFGVCFFDIGKTIYSQSDIEDTIRGVIKNSVSLYEEIHKNKTPEEFVKIIQRNGYLWLAVVCSRIMKFAKNSSFIDEDEVRLYYNADAIKETLKLIDGIKGHVNDELYSNTRKNFLDIAKQFKIEEERFTMTRTGIRSYRNLCLDEIWGSGVIPEIVLGPMCVQDKQELRKFLNHNGLQGTKITVSNIPIR